MPSSITYTNPREATEYVRDYYARTGVRPVIVPDRSTRPPTYRIVIPDEPTDDARYGGRGSVSQAANAPGQMKKVSSGSRRASTLAKARAELQKMSPPERARIEAALAASGRTRDANSAEVQERARDAGGPPVRGRRRYKGFAGMVTPPPADMYSPKAQLPEDEDMEGMGQSDKPRERKLKSKMYGPGLWDFDNFGEGPRQKRANRAKW